MEYYIGTEKDGIEVYMFKGKDIHIVLRSKLKSMTI